MQLNFNYVLENLAITLFLLIPILNIIDLLLLKLNKTKKAKWLALILFLAPIGTFIYLFRREELIQQSHLNS